MSELFISVDVETSGPSPDTYSLLSIGAVLVEHTDETFYIELKPDREGFVTEALQVCGLSLERLTSEGVDAGRAMLRFAEWLTRVSNGQRPVFVAYNAPFDWMFVSTYFHRYVGTNPFGHSALDMKALYMGLVGTPWGEISHSAIASRFRVREALTHHALADAKDQALLFKGMLDEARMEARSATYE